MRSAIDTNIVSALWSKEPTAQQALTLLRDANKASTLVICAPVYAELLAHPKATPSFVERFLKDTQIDVDYKLDETIWRAAGQAFADYASRRRRAKASQPKRLLVDFLVGAHALYQSDQLLTFDASRYRTSFPTLHIRP